MTRAHNPCPPRLGKFGPFGKGLVLYKKWVEPKVVQRWYVAHCTGILIFTTYIVIYDYMHVLHQNSGPASSRFRVQVFLP